jgi:hypothetical protein
MADRPFKTWREIRGQRPLNEPRVATYKRLMDAEARLDEVRRRRGISEEAIADALALDQAGTQSEDELYLSALSRYVVALGGCLELRAVFPEETVTLFVEA